MAADGPVTSWIGRLKAGDERAARQLWEEYFRRLVVLARAKLRGAARRVADEEDVALSAFDSFCRGAELNRFPRLQDRHDLWQLLLVITTRKAIDLRQRETRQKRGGGRVTIGQGEFGKAVGSEADLLEQVAGREPSPEFAAQLAEECERLLVSLKDPDLRQLALCKMEGFTNEEIAERQGVATRTIERKLRLIRSLLWSQEHPE